MNLPVLIFLWVCKLAASQSNYADQANNVEYIGGLPEQATLDGKVTKLDDLSPVIFLNRTKAALNCAAGSMQIELKFDDKFYGIAFADFDRNSACQVAGKGGYSYKLELPLKGCGTKQDPQRVFTNNIVVRFHPTLEMDGDETITIVCRYPPPVAPIPPPLPIKEDLVPTPIVEPPLKGFQILLIICAILFLSLLLLGLGCSYYCLRRRNMTVIRRLPLSTIGTGSEITKPSGSSLDNLNLFGELKIPRAHPPVIATSSTSGSDGPLISDTLPSDYPSESHSEIEETRSLPVSSVGSFENRAYVQETLYAEEPKFDVQVKVKRTPPSPPSLTISDSESSIARTERNLSTILEQREESIRSIDSPPVVEKTQFTYVPELHPPPKHIQPAPTYNRILRRQQEMQESQWEPMPARSIASLNTEMTDTHSFSEMVDDTHKLIAPTPPPPPPIIPERSALQMVHIDSFEPPPIVAHKPEITSHMVDDVFLKTITEKRTIEDIEKHKRLITEYYTKPKIMEDQKWNVTIKNYPAPMPDPPEWENFSDISSASGLTLTPKFERATMSLPPQNSISDNKLPLNSPELVGNISTHPSRHYSEMSEHYYSQYNIPPQNKEVPNWDVLIRVLQPAEEEIPQETTEDLNEHLTYADKMKWRQIITTESTLRTMLTEATVREDFERIRYDQRYENIFTPPKWDVIIRILAPPEKPKSQGRFKKKADWETRSRRSSLPTLYEYDSDGGSSLRTLTNEPTLHAQVPIRSRRTSKSSYRSEADLRSMSEVTVDFGRADQVSDTHSEASSYYPVRYYDDDHDSEYKASSHHPSLVRSLSQPSLARSASEFTERWVAPSRYDTGSEYTSPEVTPKSQRSSRIQPIRKEAVEQSSSWQSNIQVSGGAGTSGHTVRREFRAEQMTSFMGQSKDWYADDESDASYK